MKCESAGRRAGEIVELRATIDTSRDWRDGRAPRERNDSLGVRAHPLDRRSGCTSACCLRRIGGEGRDPLSI